MSLLAEVKEKLRDCDLQSGDIVTGTDEDFNDLDDDDEGEDDEDQDADGNPEIHLGFVDQAERNVLFDLADWREWDGGRVGGCPVWLDRSNLPLPADLACPTCQEPMKFLLQIYCPLDEPMDAFHRCLYVFCCRNAACVAAGSIKCLRSQLAKVNAFYPLDPTSVSPQTNTTDVAVAVVEYDLCTVCGCRAPTRCSVCKRASYCSKLHQKMDWKNHKLTCAADDPADVLPKGSAAWVFPEFSLNVEPEELDDEEEIDATKTTIWEDAVTKGVRGEEDDDAKLTQSDYDKALGSETTDPVYVRFLARVNRSGSDQVLRYCRWNTRRSGGSLAISSAVLKSEFRPPNCGRCGAPRAFEFQIMPQLLHFLHVDKRTAYTSAATVSLQLNEPLEGVSVAFKNSSNEDIDWGSIDVFTCTASCCASSSGELAAYTEEVVRVQPPVSSQQLSYHESKIV